jgi:hypothetical protein
MKANTDENLNELKLNVEDIKMTNRRTNLEQQRHQIRQQQQQQHQIRQHQQQQLKRRS